LLLHSTGDAAPRGALPVADVARAGDRPADAPHAPAQQRALLGGDDEREFASFDDDGRRIDGARQDGLTMLVRSADGAPLPGALVKVHWHREVEDQLTYGLDRGATDGRGGFRTSIRELGELQRVEVQVPGLGWLDYQERFMLADAPSG